MGQIIKSGKVERVALGIAVRDASADDAAYVGLDEIRGVLVEDFGDASSPALKAGIQAGDVIISVDGKRVDYVAQLQEAIAFRSAGEVVPVEVVRKGGRHLTVRVPLQRVSETRTASADNSGNATSNDGGRGSSAPALGVKVAPVDAATARQLQLPSDARGLVVLDVDDGSSASSHLATPDNGGPDMILSVEGKDVHSPEELRAALGQVKSGEIVSLRVYNVPAKTRRIERVRVR
ncbi:MAG TPA: PDZ domain-containing protein [Gemmatimonadaceae bacterium]